MTLVYVEALAAVSVVQAAAVGGAWLLRSREKLLHRYLPHLLSLAVGVLLTTALVDLLPEAVAQLGNRSLTWVLLTGSILVLFAIERVFSALTGSSTEPEVSGLATGPHVHPYGPNCKDHRVKPINLILAAMLHSFVDGTALATAFVASPRIGWLTAFAIALHEIPHRIGDFAVLIHLRQTPRRALQLAGLAGVPSLLGVVLVWLAGAGHLGEVAYLLPVSAGSFLYIAMVNLLPEIQQDGRIVSVLWQITWLITGAGLVAFVVGIFNM